MTDIERSSIPINSKKDRFTLVLRAEGRVYRTFFYLDENVLTVHNGAHDRKLVKE